MIIPVIMAGGVGSRLWPISREAFPKQFISFQEEESSLFQQSLQRLQGLQTLASPIVVCNQEHRFLVAEQLRLIGIEDATIILEPMGRNTAPAVALAALAASELDSEATLLVLAADHLIENISAFHTVINEGVSQSNEGRLVTFGIVPDKPETGYGYIKRGQVMGAGFGVDSFVEKPELEVARTYLESGKYYWNSGMFMFTAKVFLAELSQHEAKILEICTQAWNTADDAQGFKRIGEDVFSQCPSNSIDYAVMEKTSDAVVIPLDANWNDLGSWSALWEKSKGEDASGNVTKGDVLLHEVNNSLVHAESRLVSVVGLDDAVVVETSDAVFISSRDKVQGVKEIVNALKKEQRSEANLHAVVNRPWGSYESLAEEPGFQVKRIIVNPGGALSLQLHHQRSEHWIVVKGTALVTCGEKEFELRENESTYIPVETKHRLINPSADPIVLIEVQYGNYLGEDDIVRFEDVYGRES